MRYDIFIVWGNGLNVISDIVHIINRDLNFNIIRLKYYSYVDALSFVKDIYKCDTVPWEHLVSKSRYLLNTQNKCMVILVKNLKPREQLVGTGQFKHIQCQTITNLKNKIRSKFNPKFQDLTKHILPLPVGVSHEHVIHATDYESQTEYLMNYFNLKTIDYYNRYDKAKYFIPWHLDAPSHVVEKTVNLSDLRCNIIGKGIVQIKDTPHFKYIQGFKSEYISYINKHIGIELQENHFCESFDHLIDTYDVNYKSDGKKSFIIVNKNNTIVDGLHRATILLKLNIKQIRVIIL